MADIEPVKERETVVVDNDKPRSSGSWVWAVIAIIVILLLFFAFGGFNLFSGGSQTTTPTTNVNVPATNSTQ